MVQRRLSSIRGNVPLFFINHVIPPPAPQRPIRGGSFFCLRRQRSAHRVKTSLHRYTAHIPLTRALTASGSLATLYPQASCQGARQRFQPKKAHKGAKPHRLVHSTSRPNAPWCRMLLSASRLAPFCVQGRPHSAFYLGLSVIFNTTPRIFTLLTPTKALLTCTRKPDFRARSPTIDTAINRVNDAIIPLATFIRTRPNPHQGVCRVWRVGVCER